MRFTAFRSGVREGLAVAPPNGELRGLLSEEADYPGSLDFLVSRGRGYLDADAAALANGREIDLNWVTLMGPLSAPGMIVCVGLDCFAIESTINRGLSGAKNAPQAFPPPRPTGAEPSQGAEWQ
jgi:hypothetical protein